MPTKYLVVIVLVFAAWVTWSSWPPRFKTPAQPPIEAIDP